MTTFDRVLSSAPIDWLARVVTSRGPRYEPAARGWEPGAFSRARIPFEVMKTDRRRHRLVGCRSGRLTVMGRRVDGHRGWHWVCRCNCGNYVLARARHIRHQSVRMCGECEDVRARKAETRPGRAYRPGRRQR